MVQHEVNAVPVVAEDGTLAGNLSAADLRGVNVAHIEQIDKPILEFLTAVNEGKRPEVVKVTETATLLETMQLLITNSIHRVWIVDGADKPVGVVTLSDIMRKFSPYDETFSN
mmetsp:Transcript_20568/g.48999  ORF Transcript_20568/g.48999 Transcript_20568/m.48999 type:complete len:113 (+) Transcript_20568:188-526(+)